MNFKLSSIYGVSKDFTFNGTYLLKVSEAVPSVVPALLPVVVIIVDNERMQLTLGESLKLKCNNTKVTFMSLYTSENILIEVIDLNGSFEVLEQNKTFFSGGGGGSGGLKLVYMTDSYNNNKLNMDFKSEDFITFEKDKTYLINFIGYTGTICFNIFNSVQSEKHVSSLTGGSPNLNFTIGEFGAGVPKFSGRSGIDGTYDRLEIYEVNL